MNYYFPVHLDGGNRGCEAIAKGTAEILGKGNSNLIGLCSDVELDEKLGISSCVELQKYPSWSYVEKVARKIYLKIVHNPNKRKEYNYIHDYIPFLNQATEGDCVVSTGGDMMCYDDNQVIYTTKYAHEHGLKTILWGSSMGRENLTKAKEETLRLFDLIYARESLSFEFFKELGLKNVVCLPDPAFVLKPQKTELLNLFSEAEVVGINLSNLVLGDFSLDTPFGQQAKDLIEYILSQTNLNILLIPHVTWKGQDDRIVAHFVKESFSDTERIEILDINCLNYCQIRYVISKCRFFIGGRTHAVISAYSTCVPSIALGYSIKSKGIAKDLGLSDILVVNSKVVKKDNELLESFLYLCDHEDEIKRSLSSVMPVYCQRPYDVVNYLSEI